MKERAESEVEDNKRFDTSSVYRQQDYAKRIKTDKLLDGTDYERVKQGSGSGERRCSYCGVKGHNRRTCDTLKESKQAYITEAIDYRKEMAKTLPAAGIGIGTLMTVEPRSRAGYSPHGTDRTNRNYLYMVVGLDWDGITHKTGVDGFRAIELKPLDVMDDGTSYRNEYVPFPKPASHVDDPDVEAYRQKYANTDAYWEKIKIMSPVKGVKSLIPTDWYDVKSVEKSDYFRQYFKDLRHSAYWDKYYEDC